MNAQDARELMEAIAKIKPEGSKSEYPNSMKEIYEHVVNAICTSKGKDLDTTICLPQSDDEVLWHKLRDQACQLRRDGFSVMIIGDSDESKLSIRWERTME
jgi:hypothetical protein